MTLPEIPTDNLYKFAAVLGFILAVSPLAYLTVRADAAGIAVAEVEARATVAERWVDAQIALEASTATPEQIAAMRDDIRGFTVQAAKTRAELDAIDRLVLLLGGVSVAGCLICYAGLHLWYHRVQKHQDAILAAEAGKPKAVRKT